MLSAATKDLIRTTLPAVKQHATDITSVFYPLMFASYPHIKAYFNQTHQAQGTQRQALANAVVAYASNLDRLEALGDAVGRIVHKHAALNILPQHYPIIGECLLRAIRQVLGTAATDEVLAAWGEAYQQLAEILIAAEEQVYADNENSEGGWRGEREFTLLRKVRESDVITSFYFAPKDGRALKSFLPGQYTTVIVELNGETIRRNYSLSNAPHEKNYRLSIKREPGGSVSAYLHDQLQVGDSVKLTAPCGDFVLHEAQRPLFLVTGGVGITPAMSMLPVALASGRRVVFMHAALHGGVHAFRDEVAALAARHSNLKVIYCYEKPRADDICDCSGFLGAEKIQRYLPFDHDVDFYFLGPTPFMRAMYRAAIEMDIPASQIRYEFFGPLEELASAVQAELQTETDVESEVA